MGTENNLLVRLEMVWWLITAIVAAVILIPIWNELPDYPFFGVNLLFIVAFVTFSRLLFLLKYTLIAKQQYIKAGLMFLSIIVAFILVQEVTQFKIFLDENGPEGIVGSLTNSSQKSMMNYIRTEMMLFGVGSVISCVLLPFRLMVSIWKQVNYSSSSSISK